MKNLTLEEERNIVGEGGGPQTGTGTSDVTRFGGGDEGVDILPLVFGGGNEGTVILP